MNTDPNLIDFFREFGDGVHIRSSTRVSLLLGIIFEFIALFIPIFFGTFLASILVFASIQGAFDANVFRGSAFLVGLVVAVSCLISFPLFRKSAIYLAAYDSARPILANLRVALYLRLFNADAETTRGSSKVLGNAFMGQLTEKKGRRGSQSTSLTDVIFQGLWNVETLLVHVLSPYRVIAIGRPEEEFQTPGAERFYIDSRVRWTSFVSRLMGSAEIIIIRLNGEKTKGVEWEVQTVKSSNYFEKTIFLTVNDIVHPLQVAAVSDTLPSEINFPRDQEQQILYYSDSRWQSIMCSDFKDSLGNLRAALSRLWVEHPILKARPVMARRIAKAASNRRWYSGVIAAALALTIIVSLALWGRSMDDKFMHSCVFAPSISAKCYFRIFLNVSFRGDRSHF